MQLWLLQRGKLAVMGCPVEATIRVGTKVLVLELLPKFYSASWASMQIESFLVESNRCGRPQLYKAKVFSMQQRQCVRCPGLESLELLRKR